MDKTGIAVWRLCGSTDCLDRSIPCRLLQCRQVLGKVAAGEVVLIHCTIDDICLYAALELHDYFLQTCSADASRNIPEFTCCPRVPSLRDHDLFDLRTNGCPSPPCVGCA